MATFPQLKTGAIAQYPAAKSFRFRNQGVRFLDGREQRYRDSPGPTRQWTIRLKSLDESELAALESFFQNNQGRMGSFAFIDPWDGTQYANCSLAKDQLSIKAVAEMRGEASLTVVENRS